METGSQVATNSQVATFTKDNYLVERLPRRRKRILLARDRRSYCSSPVDGAELGFVAPFSLFLVARGKYF